MPTFRTSEQLTQRYAVSAARLLAYAQRGNLAMRRQGEQSWFDEEAVARLFPRRDATGVATAQRLGGVALGMGTLG